MIAINSQVSTLKSQLTSFNGHRSELPTVEVRSLRVER